MSSPDVQLTTADERRGKACRQTGTRRIRFGIAVHLVAPLREITLLLFRRGAA